MTTEPDDMAGLERILDGRRSCRGYRPDPVDRAVVERLLTAAARTPSWCNTQPWQVHVLFGDAALALSARMLATLDGTGTDDLTAATGSDYPFPEAYTGVHRERRRESGWRLYDAVGVERGDRAGSAQQGLRNFALFGAPHVAVVSAPAELGTYGAVDCGLYVQTFLLAAHALRLGACAQAALAGLAPVLHDALGLGEERRVVCGISFGHPDPDHATAGFRTSRAPLHETVTFLD